MTLKKSFPPGDTCSYDKTCSKDKSRTPAAFIKKGSQGTAPTKITA